MKLFTKLLIAALIVGILLPFTFLKGKDGRPLMSLSDLKIPDLNLPSLTNTGFGNDVSISADGNTVIYQWKDNDGNIQFTNSPPPTGTEYTSKGYDPNTNVIQSVEIPESAEEALQPEKKEESAPTDGIASAYSPEKIQKLFDDAENIEKLLNDRLEKQNALIGN